MLFPMYTMPLDELLNVKAGGSSGKNQLKPMGCLKVDGYSAPGFVATKSSKRGNLPFFLNNFILHVWTLIIFRHQVMKPHEELLLEGKVVEFEDHMGQAAFVSHQWLCSGNPDPELTQFASLQSALRNILASKKKLIDPEISTELQTLFQTQTPFQQHILVEACHKYFFGPVWMISFLGIQVSSFCW